MSAIASLQELLSEAQAAGVKLQAAGGVLECIPLPDAIVPDALIERLRPLKEGLLQYLSQAEDTQELRPGNGGEAAEVRVITYPELRQHFDALARSELGHLPPQQRGEAALAVLSRLIARFDQEGRDNNREAAIRLFDDITTSLVNLPPI